MQNWFKKLFSSKEKIKSLEVENQTLQTKLDEKQEVINKTNAYWKREIAKVKSKKTQPKSL